MNEEVKVPTQIAAIIEKNKLAMKAKQEENERIELEKRNRLITVGRAQLRLVIAETLKLVPEWLQKYDATASTFDENDLVRIGEGYNKLDLLWMKFDIPGLAPIQFNGTDNWRAASAYVSWREYGDGIPKLEFNNSSYWQSDLEHALIDADQELERFAEMQKQYQEGIANEQGKAEREARREEEALARRAAEREQEKSEELQLFKVFKDDPLAIQLLKAFMLINQERSMFESQINDANETMYSIEERWTRRAEDLRRQANEAQRRADEERDRASNLQSDLDDAESKLKKTQRGL